MTRQRFSSLSKKAKKSALLRSGAFLAERKLGFLRVMLYQVDNFYTGFTFLLTFLIDGNFFKDCFKTTPAISTTFLFFKDFISTNKR